jgi:hypothetical protein
MEPAKVIQMESKNPIPVIGIESGVKFKSTPKSSVASSSTAEDRYCQIAERAYCKAEARGFELGHEMEDWLAAEAEISQ